MHTKKSRKYGLLNVLSDVWNNTDDNLKHSSNLFKKKKVEILWKKSTSRFVYSAVGEACKNNLNLINTSSMSHINLGTELYNILFTRKSFCTLNTASKLGMKNSLSPTLLAFFAYFIRQNQKHFGHHFSSDAERIWLRAKFKTVLTVGYGHKSYYRRKCFFNFWIFDNFKGYMYQ